MNKKTSVSKKIRPLSLRGPVVTSCEAVGSFQLSSNLPELISLATHLQTLLPEAAEKCGKKNPVES